MRKFRAKQDEQYEAARNLLIPEAEKIADKECGKSGKGETWKARWSPCFSKAMDRLCEKAGLCVPFAKGLKG